jgi:Flp pilus assembly protein TadD/SAM-dependent methyltransferase
VSRKDKRSSGQGGSGWSPVAQLFATAVRHHQAGQFAEAELHYTQALAIDRKHAPSLHYLGVLAHQTGKNAVAADLIGKSIALEAKDPQSHYNLSLALRALGRDAETIAHLRRAVALKADFAEAHFHLGNALRAQGDASAAADCYRLVLQLQPAAAEAHFNLATLQVEQGRLDEAIAGYQRTLALRADHAPAHNSLGTALLAVGRTAEAVMHFQQAVRHNPGLSEAYFNLGGALLSHGRLYDAMGVINHAFEIGAAEERADQALELVVRALETEDSVDTHTLFVQCLRSLRSVPDVGRIRELMIRALTEPWGRPADLSAAATSLIKQNEIIRDCIERAQAAWPRRLPAEALFGPSAETAITQDRLLRALLESACIRDMALERFFTNARALLLQAADAPLSSARDRGNEFLAFACALACQCFINEYAFDETEVEQERIERLRGSIAVALRDGIAIDVMTLAALAAYQPLHALPGAEALLDRNWNGAVTALIELQVREPREEQAMRDSVRSVTPIVDEVSIKVREQYEQSPYPRWIKTAPIGRATTLDTYLSGKFANFRALETAAPEVLIAGCGTGQHVATIALQFTGLRTLAIDLSRASLAYAQRAARSLGLTGIEYAQADILNLGSLGRCFDMIDSSGVLHHLADPFAGWRVLLSLLRPGGVMRLGLYSALGRREVAAVRQFVAARGYSADAASIRQCRQELMGFAAGTPQRLIAETSDFFNISECRDLLFHVQEHNLTLPQIKDFLAADALTFLGFEGCARGYQRYAQLFPHDTAAADLDRWSGIENENPRLFFNMYQFWVQKPH